MTLEHLIPEASLKIGVSENSVGNIGNLILVDATTNSEQLKNKEPKEKIKHLENINYPLNKTFITSTVWTEKEIQNRTKTMAKELYHLVKIR